MATIGSLLEMPENGHKCELLVEHLLILAYDVPNIEMACKIVGPNSPWY